MKSIFLKYNQRRYQHEQLPVSDRISLENYENYLNQRLDELMEMTLHTPIKQKPADINRKQSMEISKKTPNTSDKDNSIISSEDKEDLFLKHSLFKSKKSISTPNKCKSEIYYDSRFGFVLNSLERMFMGDREPFNYEEFDQFDKAVVEAIITYLTNRILKKFDNTNRKLYQMHVAQLKRCLMNNDFNGIIQKTFNSEIVRMRRNEENVKFIMKYTMKYLKKEFLYEHHIFDLKKGEELVLKHFFLDHSKKMGLPLDAFSDPLNNTFIVNGTYKTITKDYLYIIFSQEEFKKKFFSYLDNEFKRDYHVIVKKKLKRKLSTVESMLMDNNQTECKDFVTKLSDVLRNEKGCKMPWLDQEIDWAVYSFKKRIKRDLVNHKLINKYSLFK